MFISLQTFYALDTHTQCLEQSYLCPQMRPLLKIYLC